MAINYFLCESSTGKFSKCSGIELLKPHLDLEMELMKDLLVIPAIVVDILTVVLINAFAEYFAISYQQGSRTNLRS